ncbi:MAG: hypothetical protein Q7J98_07625 [Kiritimatiellia bacterium]|nr:hypothetical protein [Kiritimatiellia bacterium]
MKYENRYSRSLFLTETRQRKNLLSGISRKVYIRKLCVLALWIGLKPFFIDSAANAASARVENTGLYGVDNRALENEFLKAAVAPHEGGKIKTLVWKPGGAQLVQPTTDGGLFHDIVIAKDVECPGELYAAGYRGEVIDAGPSNAVVRVWFNGQSRLTRGLRFQKTYVVREGAPYVEVIYDLSSHSLARKTLGLRTHSYPMLSGEKILKPYMPVATGHQTELDDGFIRS